MSDAGEELNEIATVFEDDALLLPRPLAALVLAVALARVVGDSPPQARAEVQAAAERGWRNTLAEYDAREAEALIAEEGHAL
ncbi:MAG: hypothetical protein IRY87_36205 [Acetobacteraceae bacterium]|nr:hypothetical protein [Acetobacteraceae bacterium]